MEKNIIYESNESNRTVVLAQLFANLNHPWTIIIEHDFLYNEKEVSFMHAPRDLD